MDPSAHTQIRFGPFLLDTTTGELRNNGTIVKLAPQPCRVLFLLASRPGELVTRAEICTSIWGSDTFVDFDKGLSFCVKQIRAALGEDAEIPRYIETLPRRGYRFMAAVERLEPSPACEPATAPAGEVISPASKVSTGHRRLAWIAVGASIMLLLLVAVAWRATRPELSFRERGWALVADFENRTGESIFDNSVNYALQRELSNSKFVNVVPRERIQDALLLMKKPPDIRLDLDTSREVAARDGNIQVLVAGRTEKVGSSYVLSASLVDPGSGVAVRSFSEQASTPEAVLVAARQVSSAIRRALGEHDWTVHEKAPELQKATTRSLRALQYYSHALTLTIGGRWAAVAELAERAVSEDPDFASAQLLLAEAYFSLEQHDRAAPHWRRAFDLAPTTSDRERYAILGEYYWRFAEDEEKAIQQFEVLLRLYPDDSSAIDLALLYGQQGRPGEAVPHLVRQAELRANDFLANVRAARALGMWQKDLRAARRYIERAKAIPLPDEIRLRRWEPAFVDLFAAHEYWSQGELKKVLQELERAAATLQSRTGQERDIHAAHLGSFYLTIGKLSAAESTFQLIADKNYRDSSLFNVALAREDKPALRALFRHSRENAELANPFTLARAGLPHEAEIAIRRLLATQSRDNAVEGTLKIAQGELAISRHQWQQAVELLDEGMQLGIRPLEAVESMARAFEGQGELEKAIKMLEQVSSDKTVAYPEPPTGWMATQFRLAQLYRKTGREEDAQKLEAELRKLLAEADPGHPLLAILNELPASMRASLN